MLAAAGPGDFRQMIGKAAFKAAVARQVGNRMKRVDSADASKRRFDGVLLFVRGEGLQVFDFATGAVVKTFLQGAHFSFSFRKWVRERGRLSFPNRPPSYAFDLIKAIGTAFRGATRVQ
jgi:hypothetical protein